MPLFHIHGLIGATLSSLAAGASVVCTPGFYATQFFGWLDEFRPTWYTAVPTMHQAILARAAQNQEAIARSKLRLIRSCSAALPPRVMAELERVFGVPVIESYGMTEAAHQMASNPLLPGQRKPGSVGVAAGPQIAIMADGGELLPPEMVGEIVISGANVTRGYENNPAANEAAFTKGWFRTGDQGRMDADGYLFITGRTKEIINRGGEKISPREIDEALLDHPAVAQAIAFAIPDEKLGEDVGAAVVLRADAAVSATELREFVARRLTDFKVPRRVVFLDEIPKGPTGKPQRIGLAEKLGITKSTPQKAMEAGPSSAPSTRTETLLVDTWREVLRLETVNTRDDFFLLGGDSILAAQFISRLRDASGAELSMVNLFEMPTIAQLAAWLDSTSQSQTQSKLPPIRRARGATAPLVTAAGSRSPANMHDTRAPAGETAGLPGEFPLSFSQERMWFLAEYEETHAAYIRTAAFRLRGLLNVEAIEKSLASIVERHEALRTTYHARDGLPMQVISAPFPVPLLREDLSRLDEPERMPRFMQLAIEEAHRPFDLSRDLMLRSMLLKLDREDHILLLAMHHIATDGWSQGILLSELNEIYNAYCEGLPPKLPELPVQYADFAIWQREVFESRTLAEDLTYWKKRLAGAPPVLRLPADHPRPKLLSYRGARQSLTLPKPLTESLKELSKQEKVTLFMTLVAAFNALLFRYTGQEDILIGTPVASRNQVETERLIGFFANTLVLRTDLTGDPTFRELLERVRNTALEVYAHQDLPFEKLVMMLEPERSLSYSPVFQVMFNLRNLHAEALSLRGLEIEEIDLDPRASQFDLTLMVTELAEGLSCAAIYNTDLFEAETIRRLLRHFETILGGAVKDPAARLTALPILAEPERRQLLVDWNNTRRAYPQLCVHELFEMHAEQNPGATALVFDGGRFSYRELNQRANRLAHRLRALGVGAEATVGICFERSPEAIIGLLGVLKAGEAYMPLDPAYPEERLSFMVKDAGARVVLTMRRWLDKLATKGTTVVCLDDPPDTDAQQETCNIAAGVGPDNLAYILYTSGSTGAPKGVEIPHRGIVRLVVGVDYMRFTNREVFLQLASLSFDASTFEIWGALLHGATLVLFPGRVPTAHDLGEALMRHKVTTACLTTPVFHAVVDEAPEALSTVRQLLIGGEALSAAHVRRALAALPATQIVNGYGPTESTTAACCYAVPRRFEEDASSVPIGRPISNTQVYILDKQSEPVPMGVTGELHIGGDGLARGYVNRPDLTREKFIPIPRALQNDVPPGLLYKTGDLARYLPDGNIEFLGRVDDQLKIRGYRIEPGEIEAALNQHPAVKNAAVMARPIQGGEGSLVGYVVPKDGQALTAQGLQTFLKQKLPQYMIPAQFMFMTSLPLTPVGKVDRRALPARKPPNSRPARHSSPQGMRPNRSCRDLASGSWQPTDFRCR